MNKTLITGFHIALQAASITAKPHEQLLLLYESRWRVLMSGPDLSLLTSAICLELRSVGRGNINRVPLQPCRIAAFAADDRNHLAPIRLEPRWVVAMEGWAPRDLSVHVTEEEANAQYVETLMRDNTISEVITVERWTAPWVHLPDPWR